ncbi:MAG: hypothetical protein AAFP96_10920, partial [Bacteroidota bacterium]
MKLPLKKTVLLILLTAFAYKGSSQESFLSFLQDDLDSTIQAELKRWDIPGLSIGIILNDTIRYN